MQTLLIRTMAVSHNLSHTDAFAHELQSHYDVLEKLYCLVLAERYIIHKDEVDILPALYSIKSAVLQDIELNRNSLEAWQRSLNKYSDEVGQQALQKPLDQLKNLALEIMQAQQCNKASLERMQSEHSQQDTESHNGNRSVQLTAATS